MSDVNVIVNASGGMALRAFKIQGDDTPVIGPHVLETPQNVAVRGSVDPQHSEQLSFTETEEYKEFFQKISTVGWSAAVNADIGWSVGSFKLGGRASSEQKEKVVIRHSKKVRNVVVTHCLYVPMKCFQIPESQMFLNKSAIADAKAVTNDKDADKFLAKYNSHVYTGLYHIGGIFIKEASVFSSEEVQAGFLAEKALQSMGITAELSFASGFVTVKADAKFSYVTANETGEQVSREVQVLKSEERIHVWGATSASDKNDFLTKLHADPSKWSIIDRASDQKHDFIGIWDIMAKLEDLKKPANIIRECYEKKEKEKEEKEKKEKEEKEKKDKEEKEKKDKEDQKKA